MSKLLTLFRRKKKSNMTPPEDTSQRIKSENDLFIQDENNNFIEEN